MNTHLDPSRAALRGKAARKRSWKSTASLLLVSALLAVECVVLLGQVDQTSAQAAPAAGVKGTVRDSVTSTPIAGATIEAINFSLSVTSGTDGSFAFPDIPTPESVTKVDFRVSAPGYGEWVIREARVIRDETLILRAELGPDAVEITAPTPRWEQPVTLSASLSAADTPGEIIPLHNQTEEPLPATIDVRITGETDCNTSLPYTVETIDFKEYVKHVLPNEWHPEWVGESLRAGAMAAKMYAWSIVAAGGKWSDADVYDSICDQVYNPAIEYQSTNDAIDFTWNWRLYWESDNHLVRAYYRAWHYMCEDAGLAGLCMGQWDSQEMALDRFSWDEILFYFYVDSALNDIWHPPGGYSLRYEGNGYGDLDRVKISIDGPHRPVDVGLSDFTIEWWMKARPGENDSGSISCGANDNWVFGNQMFDRDINGAGDHGDYGISLAGGKLAFGVNNGSESMTVCGSSTLDDNLWHHVAVQRRASDGLLQILVDGALDGEAIGPIGDISYRDGRTVNAGYPNEPFLVLGAEKHDIDSSTYPSFLGWIDEVRVSTTLRYSSSYPVPTGPFSPDASTAALYHFNEGYGNTIGDSSGASGGPSDGFRRYGGENNGPEWTTDSPWFVPQPTPTPVPTSDPLEPALFLPFISAGDD